MNTNTGATPERADVPPKHPDTCPAHPAFGKHYWHWMPGRLLQRSVCDTCGEEKPFIRFEGQ